MLCKSAQLNFLKDKYLLIHVYLITLDRARQGLSADFRWGQVKKYRYCPRGQKFQFCSILNFSDCHNRQRMPVARQASDKFGGGRVPKNRFDFRARRSNQLVSSPANLHSLIFSSD